jgi:hypothetical protein
VTGGDLLVLVPWLIFGAGIAVIGYLLLSRRGTARFDRHPDGDPGAGKTDGADGPGDSAGLGEISAESAGPGESERHANGDEEPPVDGPAEAAAEQIRFRRILL